MTPTLPPVVSTLLRVSEQFSSRRVENGLRLPDGYRVFADGLNHPEGVCWCPLRSVIYAGSDTGQIYRVPAPGGRAEVIANIDGAFFVGLAVDGDGAVYACDINHHCVWRIEDGAPPQRYGPEIGYPNYPVFADDGRLFVSDSGDWETANGGVVVILPGGLSERLPVPALLFANGLALRGDWLYIVESAAPGVIRVPLEGGEPETVVDLDEVIPDGLAFDQEGGLWISCWQPNRVYRLGSEGEIALVADDWSGIHLVTPTNVAFVGDRLETLVTAALAGTALSAFEPGVPGMPLNYPRGIG